MKVSGTRLLKGDANILSRNCLLAEYKFMGNSYMREVLKRIIHLGGIFFILVGTVFTLGSCGLNGNINGEVISGKNIGSKIVILPHHGITGKNIDTFYERLQKENKQYNRIVILSPDHFGNIRNPIESLPSELSEICYLGHCVPSKGFEKYSEKSEVGRIFRKDGSTQDHGLGEHIIRIKKYFPDIPVTPIMIRRNLGMSPTDSAFVESFEPLFEKENILVIASVDFSHHVSESFAQLHDTYSVEVLQNGTDQDFSKLEVDCRNCLGIAKKLANSLGHTDFEEQLRTSVDSITGKNSGLENTSHIFGEFIIPGKNEMGNVEKNSSGHFLFAGDTHWSREYVRLENTYPNFSGKALGFLYQYHNPKQDPKMYYHRIFTGFDDVIVNWESAIAPKESCEKNLKSTQMFTDPKVLPKFFSLGVTIASVANNHSHDCAEKQFDSIHSYFSAAKIQSFGYEKVLIREIRGAKYAFIGVEDIEFGFHLDELTKQIQELTKSGHRVILSIHAGKEHENTRNQRQEEIARSAVDSGARLVIGHHPHVIQDSEIYKGIPIFYSLGNFIFDQTDARTLDSLVVGCEVGETETKCEEIRMSKDSRGMGIEY